MKSKYFEGIEQYPSDTYFSLDEIVSEINFNDSGLVPVITQHADSGQVLMLAWMNLESLQASLSSSRMTYWSRSRQALWLKGETSGNFQKLVSMRLDCDGDALLCLVRPEGPSCHTGRDSCFYIELDADQGRAKII